MSTTQIEVAGEGSPDPARLGANRAAWKAAKTCGLKPTFYSGRGMMGREVVAVAGDMLEISEWLERLPDDLRASVRTDSLGRRTVAYLGSAYALDEGELDNRQMEA